MNRLSSTRFRLAPSPPILISSRACVTSRPLKLLGRPEHRLDDVLVPGAPAEVAGQGPADLLLGGVRIPLEQGFRGEHHARRAEAALQAVLVLEPLLYGVQLARPAESLHGGDLVAIGLNGEHRAAL